MSDENEQNADKEDTEQTNEDLISIEIGDEDEANEEINENTEHSSPTMSPTNMRMRSSKTTKKPRTTDFSLSAYSKTDC